MSHRNDPIDPDHVDVHGTTMQAHGNTYGDDDNTPQFDDNPAYDNDDNYPNQGYFGDDDPAMNNVDAHNNNNYDDDGYYGKNDGSTYNDAPTNYAVRSDERSYDDAPDYNNNNEGNYDENEQTPEEQPPRRQFKYSTAQMPERTNCRKWCCITMLFLFAIAFMVGLSMLLNHFFFKDDDAAGDGPLFPERSENETFPKDKVFIDQVCSTGTFDLDEGSRCRDACAPQFFECCDPFDEFDAYNYTTLHAGTNETLPPSEYDLDEWNKTCSFDTELRGCMSYAKCQALGGLIDPAPGTLPILCSQHGLDRDRTSCEEVCRPVRCCFSAENNCLADNFDICMDYAPCQNLRPGFTIETAPDDLDKACLWKLPECFEVCEQAKCCGDPESPCFRSNFLSCLTYAPCFNVTNTNITVPPMYNVLEMPPAEIIYACDEEHDPVLQVATKSCKEYCEGAACCYETDPEKNCFHHDPLGCLAWNQQCQFAAGK